MVSDDAMVRNECYLSSLVRNHAGRANIGFVDDADVGVCSSTLWWSRPSRADAFGESFGVGVGGEVGGPRSWSGTSF